MNLVKAARETYDYMSFGVKQNQWDLLLRQPQADKLQLENMWNHYLLGSPGFESIANSPRGRLYQTQSDIKEQEFEKIKFLVGSLLPAQADRQRALKALDDYQLQFMQGRYGAVLDIDLGLGDTVNQWARLILFMGLAQMF